MASERWEAVDGDQIGSRDGPPVQAGRTKWLGGPDLGRARAFGARLDLERDSLAADEAVKVDRLIEGAAMEEVFLLILGGDEAEAAIGDDLLDGTGGHEDLQHFPNTVEQGARSVRKGGDHAELLLDATIRS